MFDSLVDYFISVVIILGTMKFLTKKFYPQIIAFSRSAERYYYCRNCYCNNFLAANLDQANF